MKRYRFSLKDLLIAILLTALVSTSAQLSVIWTGPEAKQFTQLKTPYTDVLPAANAQTSNANSVSPNHKGFDGGWIIPFEVFDLEVRYVRNFYWRPVYTRKPLRIDLNGDGLLDLIYSVYDPRYIHDSNYPAGYSASFQQYIKLQRPGGLFETVYTCSQRSIIDSYDNSGTTYKYEYVGHCADTSNTSGKNFQRWQPSVIAPQLAGPGTLQANSDSINLVRSIRYTEENHDYDRNAATFIDVNGDGLQDMVFGGDTTIQRAASFAGQSRSATAVLFNNGNGFDIGFFTAN